MKKTPNAFQIRAWCLTSAFTLSYGSMFSKTWRVHQIFTNVKMKKKVIKDYQLFVVIVLFLCVDLLLLISWELLDPMKIERTQSATVVGHFFNQSAARNCKSAIFVLQSVSADEDHVLFSDTCHCEHMAKWLALLYGYKGLTMVSSALYLFTKLSSLSLTVFDVPLQLFGCFLAWETRSVTIPALNDSKYIGINVYVVMLVCLVSIGVSSVIEDATHSFLLVSTLIIFATTITLCLVFVPKVPLPPLHSTLSPTTPTNSNTNPFNPCRCSYLDYNVFPNLSVAIFWSNIVFIQF